MRQTMSDKKKLIYADDLLNAIRDDHNINGANFARIRRHIEAAPAVDAVEVVRCKDCKYRFKNNGHIKDGCPIVDVNIWMGDDDFCSYGERKDGGKL